MFTIQVICAYICSEIYCCYDFPFLDLIRLLCLSNASTITPIGPFAITGNTVHKNYTLPFSFGHNKEEYPAKRRIPLHYLTDFQLLLPDYLFQVSVHKSTQTFFQVIQNWYKIRHSVRKTSANIS